MDLCKIVCCPLRGYAIPNLKKIPVDISILHVVVEFKIQVYHFYDLPKVSFIYSGGHYPKKKNKLELGMK